MRYCASVLFPLVCLGCGCQGDSIWGLPDQEGDSPQQVKPVESNQDPEVPEGFGGDIHPLLHGKTELEVTAHWSPIKRGRAFRLGYFPERFYQPFRNVSLAEPRRFYRRDDFSALFPKRLENPGQTWVIDPSKAGKIIKQLHSSGTMRLAAPGRLAGPNGSFGILRAVSATHAEMFFRLHCEFRLASNAWFTPAYFSGRLLVNKEAGTVEYFRLALPTDKTLNATLTVRLPKEALIDIVRVERMELDGGDIQLARAVKWLEEINEDDAHRRLKGMFYKFSEIQWVPFHESQAMSRKQNKPIFAMVQWGALDDQSC